MTPGKLLKVPFDFRPLRGTPTTWEWLRVTPGYLLCLEEMDMTREWAASSAAVAAARAAWDRRARPARWAGTPVAAAAAARAAAEAWEEYNKIYDLAREEFEKTGKIHGFKFLCPEGKNHIWLSRYDVEYLRGLENLPS